MAYLLTLLGLILITFGAVERGWSYLLIWLGIDFCVAGFAHWRGFHGVFGKKPDGSLAILTSVVFAPLLIYGVLVWHLTRLLSREPAYNRVTDRLVIGRRLLPSEIKEDYDNYVDLTAEFAEPSSIRRSPSYFNFPILDGAAPSLEALRQAVCRLRPGTVFVHCAQGHGRTGLFALAILLETREANNVEDALRLLTTVRPSIRLNESQRKIVHAYARFPAS